MKVIPFSVNWYLMSLIQVQNGFSSLQMKKHLFFHQMSPLQQPYHLYTKSCNEVNFNTYPHTNTKWKTSCKFAKIALRLGYLAHCYCYTKFQKFDGMCVSL